VDSAVVVQDSDVRGGRLTVEIEVLDDPARACAAMLVGAAAAGDDIVLTGGSTPRAAYEEMVSAIRAVDVDISDARFWFGDERCVPADDERSNYRMAAEALFDPLSDRGEPEVHRMRGELGPYEGAEDYERQLEEAGSPEFDLLLLGIGPDGHTASLFPDQPTVQERERAVVPVPEAGLEPFVPRISFTLSTIARAKKVVVLATGESKAAAVAAAFGPGAEPDPHVPSSFLPSVARDLLVLLDPAAASQLPDRESAQ
jgi:6-phosphogluconolactonase